MTPADLVQKLIEAARALDSAQAELVRATRENAEKQRKYRQAKSNAYLATSGTVAERDAQVTKVIEEEAFGAHLSEGLERSALEAVRNARQILSAWQSISTAIRAEAELVRTGPAGY